ELGPPERTGRLPQMVSAGSVQVRAAAAGDQGHQVSAQGKVRLKTGGGRPGSHCTGIRITCSGRFFRAPFREPIRALYGTLFRTLSAGSLLRPGRCHDRPGSNPARVKISLRATDGLDRLTVLREHGDEPTALETRNCSYV